jgi:hypothetical protein
MDFDQFVRKYLAGTLSDAELEQFRELLQRVPEYRVELRQILELRSLMHDDALRLVPPEDFSERVRLSVGSMFTTSGTSALMRYDALRLNPPKDLSEQVRSRVGARFQGVALSDEPDMPEDDERKKRRGFVLPVFRIGAGALATATVAVVLAIAPGLFESTSPSASEGRSPIVAGAGDVSSRPNDAPLDRSTRTGTSALADMGMVGDALRSGTLVDTPAENAPVMRGTAVTRTAAASSDDSHTRSVAAHADQVRSSVSSDAPATVQSHTPALAQQSDAAVERTDNAATSRDEFPSSVLFTTPEDPFKSSIVSSDGAQSAFDAPASLADLLKQNTATQSVRYNPQLDSIPASADQLPASAVSYASAQAVLPEWRRLAFGFTVGSGLVDAAEADIQLQNSYSLYFSVSLSSNDRIGIEGGEVSSQRSRSSRFASLSAKQVALAKESQGSDPEGIEADSPAPNYSTVPTFTTGSDVRQPQLELQPYGAIFYDRRIKLDDSWDVCGRLTFGGTDGALVSSARAYAAFNPTREIAVMLGVGGSTLYKLDSKESWGNVSYGVHCGLEVGL